MWLIDTSTLKLKRFVEDAGRPVEIDNPKKQPVRYVILSHWWEDRWEETEMSFQDVQSGNWTEKSTLGREKIEQTCRRARDNAYPFAWIDTCCIDKTSTADLTEAINSMYRYYENAEECYAHLNDVEEANQLAKSEWFCRGWTLQELIASSPLLFFNKSWKLIGKKEELADVLQGITGIDTR